MYGNPLPSRPMLTQIMDTLHGIVFPGSRNDAPQELLHGMITHQIAAGLRQKDEVCVPYTEEVAEQAASLADAFMLQLPELQRLLQGDVQAAYDGDPAATSKSEVIFCYPCITALLHYRVAHMLDGLGVPLIPRVITEMAHSATGIDIHPSATIGEHFTIDHGTGVVIGATCIIGNNVKLYQGVTLGAKSFPLDEKGNPIKGIPRHPIIEDNVIIYSNSTILGRITIGHDSVIGGNLWVTHDVPSGSKLSQKV